MRRNVDLHCPKCDVTLEDRMCREEEVIHCLTCELPMEQVWWTRRHRQPAQWDDSTAVMVHMSNDPSVPSDLRVRYPGSHDAKLKPGYERVYLRSLREVERFERDHKVMCHAMHYDQNGRSLDG